jgi:signal transduction histidine kinase
MTLKSRLRLTILGPLLAVAVGYSLVSLSTGAAVLFREASERAMLLASQTQTLLVQRVDEYSRRSEPGASLEDTERLWMEMATRDEALAKMLEQTMASTRTVVEIDVRGKDGKVLSSSNPQSIGSVGRKALAMREWAEMGRARQIWRVFTKKEEYETIIPLGLPGSKSPTFEVRVLVSSELLRNTLEPEVSNLLFALAMSLLASIGIAMLTADLAFVPLRRLGEAIDKVSRGEALSDVASRDAQEVQVVESKLSLLGEQVRGAREDLKQMRGNVQQLLERMEDAVLLFDEQEKLVNAGRAIEKFLGRGRWEMSGAHVSELFPAGTAAGDLVQGAMALGQDLSNAELTLGARRILVDMEVLEAKGFLVTIRDAEAKQSITRQLDVSQRLSALNRLTGGVAHEIKNPLNSIGLHLEILKERIAGSDEVAEEELRILREETRRLDRVVKTFLDFTKPVELKLAPLDLFAVLSSLVQFMTPEAQQKNVKLSVECEAARVKIRGDADLLKQAFLNLLRNGMEAMPEGGPLEILIRREAAEIVVVVKDAGVGIPVESKAKIFQLYFTTKTQGSGIGLAVTYRVVQLHNGSIQFESQPQEGTSFELRFPKLEDDGWEASE